MQKRPHVLPPKTKKCPPTLVSLGRALRLATGDAVPLLTAAQSRYPNHFRLNFQLGAALLDVKTPGDAVGYYRAALAVRPESPGADNNLGNALKDTGRLDEAMRHYRRALALDPKSALAHTNLGVALEDQGRRDEAIGHYLTFREWPRHRRRLARGCRWSRPGPSRYSCCFIRLYQTSPFVPKRCTKKGWSAGIAGSGSGKKDQIGLGEKIHRLPRAQESGRKHWLPRELGADHPPWDGRIKT